MLELNASVLFLSHSSTDVSPAQFIIISILFWEIILFKFFEVILKLICLKLLIFNFFLFI